MADLDNTADKAKSAAKNAGESVSAKTPVKNEGDAGAQPEANPKDVASVAAESAKASASETASTAAEKATAVKEKAAEAADSSKAAAEGARSTVEDKVAELRQATFDSLSDLDESDTRKAGAALAAVIAAVVLFFVVRAIRNR